MDSAAIKRRLHALNRMTVANGCTPEEARAAADLLKQMMARYGFRRVYRGAPPPQPPAMMANTATRWSAPQQRAISGHRLVWNARLICTLIWQAILFVVIGLPTCAIVMFAFLCVLQESLIPFVALIQVLMFWGYIHPQLPEFDLLYPSRMLAIICGAELPFTLLVLTMLNEPKLSSWKVAFVGAFRQHIKVWVPSWALWSIIAVADAAHGLGFWGH